MRLLGALGDIGEIVMTGLSDKQLKQFQEDGCIAIPKELAPDVIKGLIDRSHELLETFDLASHPMTKFETGGDDGERHVGDDYFITSSDKVHYFFEEDAFDASGKLIKPKDRAINKIGHALHELDPAFRAMSLTARNAELARDLGFTDPRILQSMLICKQPEIGGEVPTHQDGTFLFTEPLTAIGFWYALEDCTASNGALQFVPGSHKTAQVHRRFVRNGTGTGFEDVPNTEAYQEPAKEEFVTLECPAGSLVLIHNSVLHRSSKNVSEKSRYAYTFHVIDGTAKYDEKNWLQVPPSGGTNFTKLAA